MRTKKVYYNTNGVMKYPDERVFAFNPNYVEFNGLDNDVTYAVLIVNGYRIEASVYKGHAKIDISKVIQSLFNNPKTIRVITVNVEYLLNDDYRMEDTFNMQAIWGYTTIGERLNTIGAYSYNAATNVFERHLRYFIKYPQVVQVFNGTDFQTLTVNFENLPQKVFDFSDYMNTVNDLVWDDTFDVTFKKTFTWDNLGPARIVLHRDESSSGYFLRWIDNLGYMQYYLFEENKKTLKITNDNEVKQDVIANGIYFGGGKQVNKSKDVIVTCAAVNVTKEEMSYVQTIVSSPVVELFKGKTSDDVEMWVPVALEAENFDYDERKEMQNFEIKFSYPVSNVQQL